ncbi:MAG: TonB-dependent receptor [Mediterranea sp.]|jgi:TonB-linked SusC/RagA family outer membrane protein|nr:TonB-dependent receptor [Mediterranea sp.]
MKKRVFVLLSCLFMSIGLLTAQTSGVQGIVISAEDGEPVIGASVLVKGTTVGAVTDIDGKFTITNLPAAAKTLQVSFVGMLTSEAAIRPGILKIELKPDAGLLDEVVITGYGNVKKSAYAGSASTVRADRIKDIPVVSFTDMLQGNASGVQFSASSGQPGSASSINIRGMGSMNASTQPLYVIDGVPVRSGNIDEVGSDAGLDVMSTIAPSDIENISIIKDAAAASLYGSRAANGVVIITTKKGRSGKPVISLKADWGSSDFAMQYRPVMGGAERREYIYNALYRGQIRDGETEADARAYADEEVEVYAPVPWCGYVDWDALLFQKGNHQTYEASISGGTEKFKYFSSLAYLNQEGVTVNSALERISARLNVDYNATDKLKLGANLLFSNVNQDVYSEGTSYTSPFYSTRNCVVPSDAVYNEDGTWDREFIRNSDRNPLLAATYDYNRQYVNRSFNTLYAEYEFIKDLKFKTTLSYDYTVVKGNDWSDSRTSNGDDYNGSMSKTYREYKKMVWANQLGYATTIADNHHLDVLAGFETDDQYTDYLSGSASNFATAGKNAISNGMTTESVGGSNSNQRIVSYLSRVNYDYAGKYFLGGSYRVDGSSRLHRDNRWGSFWSLSGAWRMIEEPFMEPAKGWLSDLKLRASYGANGTLPSDSYGYMGLSSLTSGYMDQPGIIPSQITNNDLKWETNYNLNLGLDFGLWNRINVSLEYYIRTTKNLLMDRPISMTTGFSSYLMNIGEMQNRGVELEINSENVKTKDFSWRTGLNISHNRNEIVTLDGTQTEIISGSQIRKVGKSYRTFYMIEFAGINPETGAPQFYKNDVDENGNYNKEITEKNSEAKAIALDKHAEPTLIGGLSNSLTYKWFDLNILFSCQFGGYSYDNWAQKTEHGGYDLEANIPIYYRDSWKNPGDVTNYEVFIEDPNVGMHSVTTTRRLHSSDFIRLKTLNFGFTLPQTWTRKAGIDKVRLFASANNLWTWAAYDYYDPEAVSAGTAIWGTPPLKTVTFGLNMNF